MDREISPPASKRRKVTVEKPALPTTGSNPASIDDPRVLRVFSWNINGISPFLQTSLTSFVTSSSKRKANEVPTPSLREFLRRHHWPQILCLQEIKIAPTDTNVLKALRRAVKGRKSSNPSTSDPEYEVFTTLPNDKHNARGLGGKGRIYGVASIIRVDFRKTHVSNVRSVDWDAEGRFSIIEIEDPSLGTKLSIWNVYAVNGTNNEYRNPETGAVMGTRHDRKLAVHRLMMEECKTLEGEGWDVLIIGDLNVAPARIDGFPNLRTFPEQHAVNRADFNRRFLDSLNGEGFKGVDVWRAIRGTENKFTYYPRNRQWGTSSDRVDLAIVSKPLIDDKRIGGCEIWNTEIERGPSDHFPISVDIKLD